MYALIHDSQLILGPIQYNYRLINSDLEDLELDSRVSPRDYENVPIRLGENTFLLGVEKNIPEYDARFQSVGNFDWELVMEENNDVPRRVKFNYQINDRSLDQVKDEYKRQVVPIRKEKENTLINLEINQTQISVSTSREQRLAFVSKLVSSSAPHNFKFENNIWVELTDTDLQYIISEIDLKVQEAFDWEYQKLQEIDACQTLEEVYNVVLRENVLSPEDIINTLPTMQQE